MTMYTALLSILHDLGGLYYYGKLSSRLLFREALPFNV